LSGFDTGVVPTSGLAFTIEFVEYTYQYRGTLFGECGDGNGQYVTNTAGSDMFALYLTHSGEN